MEKHKKAQRVAAAVFTILIFTFTFAAELLTYGEQREEKSEDYIKWVDFAVSVRALEDTMRLDIETYDMLYHISWIDSLSYLACKNGNSWGSYSTAQLNKLVEKLGDLYTVDELMSDNKYYSYYKKAFSAVLGGLLGEYEKQAPDGNGSKKTVSGYGLVAYSPIAEGFGYSHYDDFGNSRSYGYRRSHQGNDLIGGIGTPIVAVEGGTVECIGWNQYGGWRIGIRSFDGLRSYYYAHLRKDSPYHVDLKQGSVVKAGQVIGYLGMTGYSAKENVNGMNVPHLHFGMQLVFDESQKEGINQIWIDVYKLVKLLARNRATVLKDAESGHYYRKYDIYVKGWPEELSALAANTVP